MDKYIGVVLDRGLKNIFYDKKNYSPPFDICTNDLYVSPNLGQIVKYFSKSYVLCLKDALHNTQKKITEKLYSSKHKKDNWQISIVKNSGRLRKPYSKIEMNKNFWYADPFYSPINGGSLICERFSKNENKAVIVCFKLNKGIPDIDSESVLLDNNIHASYPYTFEKNEKFYMIPEEGKKGINLYELCIKDGVVISKFVKNLLPEGYVDTSYIRSDDCDFLFTNPTIGKGPKSVLEIYFCNDILKDNLTPHKLNPILIDTVYARNGGRIMSNEDYFIRPSQNGINYYGEHLNFTKIIFSKDDFKFLSNEEFKIEMKNSQIHHFDTWSEDNTQYSIFDSNGKIF